MFWQRLDMMEAKEASVSVILQNTATEQVQLDDLFAKEDCIQETKARNAQLIKVLTRKDILMQLVSLITQEPPGEVDDKNRFKKPTLAVEVLNADLPEIDYALSQSAEYLDALFGFFDSSEALNPILTSFVTRTLGLLIARRPQEISTHLSTKEKILDATLQHLNVTAVIDLFIRLITGNENETYRYRMCEWLNAHSFMEKVAAYLDATKTPDADFHNNSAQLLSDIIRFSREQQLQQLKPDDNVDTLTPETYANDLLKTADSEAFIGLLVSNLLRSANSQTAVVNCLTVLGAPFEFIPVNFDGNNEQKLLFSELSLRVVNARIDKYSKALSPVIPQLHELILKPPMRNSVISELIDGYSGLVSTKRVGQARLQLVRLFALLISFGRVQLNQAIFDSKLVLTLLDMFFQYPFNSFFHSQIQNCNNLILHNLPLGLSDPPNVTVDHPLLHQLIVTGQLHRKIMVAWRQNTEEEASGKTRRPYMGHLLAMCLEMSAEQSPTYPFIEMAVNQLGAEAVSEWEDFMRSTVRPLAEIQARCLSGQHPLQPSSTGMARSSGVSSFENAQTDPSKNENEAVIAMDVVPSNLNISDEKSTQASRMRLHGVDSDESDDSDDDEMKAATDANEDSDLSGMEVADENLNQAPKVPTPDWPSQQPLHVAEKAGIERMEEAENANSPWDNAMDTTVPVSADFPWNSDSQSTSKASDAWADFSVFPNTGNSSQLSDPFSNPQLLAENSSPTNDADDAPFEFSARESLTPEPSSPNDDLKDSPLKEASLSSNTGTDDVQMDPFVAGDAPINTPSTASTAPSSATSSGGGKESQESSSKKPHSDGSHIT